MSSDIAYEIYGNIFSPKKQDGGAFISSGVPSPFSNSPSKHCTLAYFFYLLSERDLSQT